MVRSIAVHPVSGELFVSDGYGEPPTACTRLFSHTDNSLRPMPRAAFPGNSRIHRLNADGSHILSWGADGTGNGEFNLPHNIVIHPDLDKGTHDARIDLLAAYAGVWRR